jgi:hypothetical protein
MLRCHMRMPEPRREAPFKSVRDKRIGIPKAPGNDLPVPGLCRNYRAGQLINVCATSASVDGN